jgi:hypothetical protein
VHALAEARRVRVAREEDEGAEVEQRLLVPLARPVLVPLALALAELGTVPRAMARGAAGGPPDSTTRACRASNESSSGCTSPISTSTASASAIT